MGVRSSQVRMRPAVLVGVTMGEETIPERIATPVSRASFPYCGSAPTSFVESFCRFCTSWVYYATPTRTRNLANALARIVTTSSTAVSTILAYANYGAPSKTTPEEVADGIGTGLVRRYNGLTVVAANFLVASLLPLGDLERMPRQNTA